MQTHQGLLALLALANLVSSSPILAARAEAGVSPAIKQNSQTHHDAPIVDLDYSRYQGSYDPNFDVNIYLGIRYAAPPKRWQLPEDPAVNRTGVIRAVSQPNRCPQSNVAPQPASVNFTTAILGDEDCLFLNVYAPKNAKNLPVLLWIHGGGYGLGAASTFDFSYLDRTTGNGFISVIIQYRLGAFGFLSSADLVKQGGKPNAALHDMRHALKWVKKYISRFGGNPDQVTISGGSAGGGSVMLLAMANGGEEGTSLFRRGIASSPYLPTQPNYDDDLPTDYYLQFAQRAGCLGTADSASDSAVVYKCLQNADTLVLQNASAYTSMNAKFGLWAFIPVTDGTLIRDRPTNQLLAGKVNGERIVTGNTANEGTYFVPQTITSQALFVDYVKYSYPNLSPENITSILSLYNISSSIANLSPNATKFDTDGLHRPYATEMSNYALGWQQAANNLYAETTFVCPAYWLADAYSLPASNNTNTNKRTTQKASWRYQFSTPDAFHGRDMSPILANPTGSDNKTDATFRRGFQSVWGQFILTGDPRLPGPVIAGAGAGGAALAAAGEDRWRAWGSKGRWDLLNLNVTAVAGGNGSEVRAEWSVVDARAWEGGRRERCDLWAGLGSVILE